MAVKFRMSPAGDSSDLVRVLKRVQPFGLVVADKRYNPERNREYVQKILGARTMISVRAASRLKIKMRERWRMRMEQEPRGTKP